VHTHLACDAHACSIHALRKEEAECTPNSCVAREVRRVSNDYTRLGRLRAAVCAASYRHTCGNAPTTACETRTWSLWLTSRSTCEGTKPQKTPVDAPNDVHVS